MPKITYTGFNDTSPAFCGDFLSREHLLPGGVKITAADFAANANGKRYVPAGTRVGRTFTERDTNAFFGVAADADDEIYILAYDIVDLNESGDGEVLRGGTLIKENFLPGWAGETAALKAKVRGFYQTTLGAGGNA